ncbi:MAG: AAA family ATPase [Phycisphaerae bacterium]|nr:AAA family ATPase [Phycisphaerae bacterium]
MPGGELDYWCTVGCTRVELLYAIQQAKLRKAGDALVTARMNAVKAGPVRWLWPGVIPLGKVTMLAGDPGLGKSLVALDVAARVTTGSAWPAGGAACERGTVLLLSAEDDLADTVRPRLDAAGGNAEYMTAVQAIKLVGDKNELAVDLSRDLPSLAKMAKRVTDIRLIVIDPISAYLGGNSSLHGVMRPLAKMASESGAAVLCVHHLGKKAQSNPLYRLQGSVAFAAAARQVLAVAADPDDRQRRLMLPVKSNLSADNIGGLAYRVAVAEGAAAPRVAWESEPVEERVAEVMAPRREYRVSRLDEAEVFLHEALADGEEHAAEAINAEAAKRGINKMTLWRAGKTVGVRIRREPGRGVYLWQARAEEPRSSEPVIAKT